METIRIKTTEDPLFASLWEIYENSFPYAERRTPAHQRTALRSADYHMNAYAEDGAVAGLIGYWEFPDYLYVEHLAVNPELRGSGHGSRIMRELIGSTDKTIILEIEPVEDEATARRLRFYEKLGFRTNPYRHPQHRYHEDDPDDLLLTILSYPDPISAQTYERFNRDLQDVVMRRP